MFNEKARKIDDLTKAKRQCDEVHGPWINLAMEVSSRALEAEHESTLDFGTRVGMVVDTMVSEQRSAFVLSQFNKLPAEQGWQIIADLFEDDAMREILANRRAELARLAEGRKAIHEMATATRLAGRIDIATVPAESEVNLRLYDPEYYDKMKKRPPHHDPDRSIKAIAMGDGTFQVIDDSIRNGVSYDEDKVAKPDLSDHQITQFGTGYKDGELLTNLYRFASVKCEVDGNLKKLWVKDKEYDDYDLDLVLYDVEVDGVSMFTQPDEQSNR